METLKSLLHSLKRVLIIIAVIALLVLSIRVTKPDLVKLVSSFPKAKSIMGQLLRPEILGRESEKITVAQLVPVPCGSVANPEVPASGPRITVDPPCGNPKNAELSIRWILPDGGLLSIKNAVTNANGELTETMELRPITAAVDGKPAQLAFEITLPEGKVVASQTLKDVLDAMFVTIFMALIATTIGTIFAVPLSFLAASNITRKGWLGSAVSRAFLNIIRSYEPLVLATIFAMIVGFGSPFAGVIALSITTAASLGKMFSE